MSEQNGAKILIADDERALARALELKLNHLGFQTRLVYDGQEVLEIIKKEKFDLVILDLIMPKVDGFAVLEEFKKSNYSTPVIVTSNLSQEEDIAKTKTYNVEGYIIKSNTPISKIVEIVKEKLEKK